VPPSSSYVVRVAATSGPCWVQVTSMPAGTVTLSQTLAAGSAQSVNLEGANSLELGAPTSATVTLDGTPVVLPTGHSTPFTLTFTPPPAGA
jgi:hypothetical protein